MHLTQDNKNLAGAIISTCHQIKSCRICDFLIVYHYKILDAVNFFNRNKCIWILKNYESRYLATRL